MSRYIVFLLVTALAGMIGGIYLLAPTPETAGLTVARAELTEAAQTPAETPAAAQSRRQRIAERAASASAAAEPVIPPKHGATGDAAEPEAKPKSLFAALLERTRKSQEDDGDAPLPGASPQDQADPAGAAPADGNTMFRKAGTLTGGCSQTGGAKFCRAGE